MWKTFIHEWGNRFNEVKWFVEDYIAGYCRIKSKLSVSMFSHPMVFVPLNFRITAVVTVSSYMVNISYWMKKVRNQLKFLAKQLFYKLQTFTGERRVCVFERYTYIQIIICKDKHQILIHVTDLGKKWNEILWGSSKIK